MTVPEAQPQGGDLVPCPKCRDIEALCLQLGNVFCGRCSFEAPIETWNTRADLPRATTFKPMCDDPECSVCKRMAELHAENIPRTTGETTVETALVELREMFPKTFIRVRSTTEIEYNEYADKASYRERHAYVLIMKHGEFSAQTLADCMAQVRAATRTEGEGVK
jgi:hypothetical protein